MGISREKKAAYDKAYYKANKEKKQSYRDTRKDKTQEYNKALNISEGIGVYKVVYLSGVYIGSGQIYNRRVQHLTGNSGIAKTLNEKAVSFEVIAYTHTLDEVRVVEQEYISSYGLDNLLNTRKVGGCSNGT